MNEELTTLGTHVYNTAIHVSDASTAPNSISRIQERAYKKGLKFNITKFRVLKYHVNSKHESFADVQWVYQIYV